MPNRPRDLCSAAFFNDVARLRLLAHQDAPGGTAYRFRLERLAPTEVEGGAAGEHAPPASAVDEEGEEEALFDEEVEAALDADPEMVRLRQQYTLEEEVDDAEEDELAANASGSEAAAAAAGGSGEVFDAEAIAADMSAQETDMARYKALLRHALREKFIVELLQRQGPLRSGPRADVVEYGLFFTAREQPVAEEWPHAAATPADHLSGSEAPATGLEVRWLPVKGSPYTASPLHWAVVGRAHEAIRFLVESGVDPAQAIAHDAAGEGGFAFPPALTPARLAAANASAETQRQLAAAVAARESLRAAVEQTKQRLEGALEQRKARQEKRRLGRDQRRAAREERRAAEEDEEGAEAHDDGDENSHVGRDDEDGGAVTDNEGDY